MKRAFLIIVGALALAGFLRADIAWPKTSIAEEISAAAAEAVSIGGAEAPPLSLRNRQLPKRLTAPARASRRGSFC